MLKNSVSNQESWKSKVLEKWPPGWYWESCGCSGGEEEKFSSPFLHNTRRAQLAFRTTRALAEIHSIAFFSRQCLCTHFTLAIDLWYLLNLGLRLAGQCCCRCRSLDDCIHRQRLKWPAPCSFIHFIPETLLHAPNSATAACPQAAFRRISGHHVVVFCLKITALEERNVWFGEVVGGGMESVATAAAVVVSAPRLNSFTVSVSVRNQPPI